MLRITLFVLGINFLLFGCGHNPNNKQQTQAEPPTSANAQEAIRTMPLETVRELAQTRKALKMNLTNELSPLENIEELGPNTSSTICRNIRGEICVSGMIKEFVVDSEDDQRFVIATETSGAWLSEDAGNSWTPIDSDWPGLRLNWVVQSQDNPDLFYFCGLGLGLLVWDKTSDHGLVEWVGTIDGVPASTFDFVLTLKIDPQNPAIHYLTTAGEVYKYEDSQYTIVQFDPLDNEIYLNLFGDLEIIPGEGLLIHHGDYIRSLRPDGSANIFQTGFPPVGGEIAYSPSNPKIIYHFARTSDSMIMHRSRDGGINWNPIALPSFMADGNNQAHARTLEIYPYSDGKELILCGSVQLRMAIIEEAHTSTPQFETVVCAHGDFQGSLPHKDEIFVYDDGGLYAIQKSALDQYFHFASSVDIGSETRPLSLGLTTLQAVEVKYHEASGRLAIGLWHNGSWLRETDGQYDYVSWGDGFDAAFHPEDDDIVYTSAQKNSLYRYHIEDGARNWISNTLPKGPFQTKIFTHPDFPEALFYLDDGIRMIADAD
ncbi:MAG: hypothetical protein AAFN10_23125, partial [Bacteroidota bacterium]